MRPNTLFTVAIVLALSGALPLSPQYERRSFLSAFSNIFKTGSGGIIPKVGTTIEDGMEGLGKIFGSSKGKGDFTSVSAEAGGRESNLGNSGLSDVGGSKGDDVDIDNVLNSASSEGSGGTKGGSPKGSSEVGSKSGKNGNEASKGSDDGNDSTGLKDNSSKDDSKNSDSDSDSKDNKDSGTKSYDKPEPTKTENRRPTETSEAAKPTDDSKAKKPKKDLTTLTSLTTLSSVIDPGIKTMSTETSLTTEASLATGTYLVSYLIGTSVLYSTVYEVQSKAVAKLVLQKSQQPMTYPSVPAETAPVVA